MATVAIIYNDIIVAWLLQKIFLQLPGIIVDVFQTLTQLPLSCS